MFFKAAAILSLAEYVLGSVEGDNESKHVDCEFSWANLLDKRSVKIKAVVEEVKNPIDIGRMTVPRILSMEETTAEGEVMTYEGEEVRGLLDLDMARMFRVKPGINDKFYTYTENNSARCERLLRELGKYLGEHSPVYRRDAKLLGIIYPSDSFVAWSILNLKLEKSFTDLLTEENGCDVEFDVCYNEEVKKALRKGTKKKHKKKKVTVDASWVPGLDRFMILSLNDKGKNLLKEDDKRGRLHSDLLYRKHVVTTETVPDFKIPENSCKFFIKYTDWQLRLVLGASKKITPCLEVAKAKSQSDGMGYIMWLEHDKARVKKNEKIEKRYKDTIYDRERILPRAAVMGVMPIDV